MLHCWKSRDEAHFCLLILSGVLFKCTPEYSTISWTMEAYAMNQDQAAPEGLREQSDAGP